MSTNKPLIVRSDMLRTMRSILQWILLCAVVLVFAWSVRTPIGAFVTDRYEDISFMRDPTAARAFAIAQHHFQGGAARAYDLERAHEYYLKTVRIDPDYPLAYHQLARTSFILHMYDAALAQITLQLQRDPNSPPNSYYVRGLIYGFMERYSEAQRDFETYLKSGTHEWYGYNDYAWILLKEEKYEAALDAVDEGLHYSPDNAWLLNSKATALYELGRFNESLEAANAAREAAQTLTAADWSRVNPGNDPSMGTDGIAKLRGAIDVNMAQIKTAIETASSTVRGD